MSLPASLPVPRSISHGGFVKALALMSTNEEVAEFRKRVFALKLVLVISGSRN